MKAFDMFAEALRGYCKSNNLDFEKVKTSPKCGNDAVMMIQRFSNQQVGLEQEIPAEILLIATKDENGDIRIGKGEGAEKHLSICEKGEKQ